MKKLMKLLYFLPAMMLMIMIFYFSSQEAIASSETSTSLGRGIIFIKSSILGENLSESEIEEQALYIDHTVRKTAHATEYALLGFCVCFGLIKPGSSKILADGRPEDVPETIENITICKKLKLHLISAGTGILYACSDELHQYFVPGRSAQVSDVLLDSTGVILGVVIFWGLIRIIEIKRNR